MRPTVVFIVILENEDGRTRRKKVSEESNNTKSIQKDIKSFYNSKLFPCFLLFLVFKFNTLSISSLTKHNNDKQHLVMTKRMMVLNHPLLMIMFMITLLPLCMGNTCLEPESEVDPGFTNVPCDGAVERETILHSCTLNSTIWVNETVSNVVLKVVRVGDVVTVDFPAVLRLTPVNGLSNSIEISPVLPEHLLPDIVRNGTIDSQPTINGPQTLFMTHINIMDSGHMNQQGMFLISTIASPLDSSECIRGQMSVFAGPSRTFSGSSSTGQTYSGILPSKLRWTRGSRTLT
jgi:hypothetical protein